MKSLVFGLGLKVAVLVLVLHSWSCLVLKLHHQKFIHVTITRYLKCTQSRPQMVTPYWPGDSRGSTEAGVYLRGAPVDCKMLAYTTLLWSRMEYASIIWVPHTKCDSEKLERVQHSAARWILSSYSWHIGQCYPASLASPAWTTGRLRVQRLVFMCKILHDHVAVLAASVDLILFSRLSCDVNANSQKLVTVRSFIENYRQ